MWLGRDVALKVLQASEEGNTEFLRARELAHPNIVRVLDAGRLGTGHTWFTMERVEAVTLAQVRASWGAEGVLRVIAGAALALDYVHRRGFVHGDVKPSNILVEATARGPRARVIDFGLSAAVSSGQLSGTPAYMAPELLKEPTLTPQSDLYALGVTAYEALSGRNPFAAPSVEEALRRQLQLTPLPLSGVSSPVAEIITRLLDKEPSARFASARALLFALGEAAPEAMDTSAAPLPERGVWVGPLQPVTRLQEQAAAPGLTWLQGAPGVGKTRVADELVVRARLDGRSALRLPAAQVSQAEALNLDLLVLEDLDRLRPRERAEAMAWLRRLAARARVVVTARRIPDALRQAGDGEVGVSALPLEALEALVLDLLDLGERNAPVAASLAQACQGNPGLLHALLQALHARGVLRRGDGRWVLDPRLSRGDLLEALDVGALALPEVVPSDLARCLKRCAVAFAPWDAAGLAELLGEPIEPSALEQLVALGWLLRRGDGGYRFVCPSARRRWHRRLDPVERARLHHRAAQALAPEREPEALERRARHLWEVERRQEALGLMRQAAERATGVHERLVRLEWLIERLEGSEEEGGLRLEAGDLWMQVGHFDKAQPQYQRADELLGGRASVLRRLGLVLCEQGRYGAAEAFAKRALTARGAREEEAETRFTLGWTAAMRGDYEAALEHAQRGLGLDDLAPVSEARLRRLLGTVHWHQGAAQAACDAFTQGKALAARHGASEVEAACWMGLGTGLFMQGRHEASLGAYTRAVALHERDGRVAQLAKCLNGQGIALYLLGRWGEAATAWEGFRQTCSRTGNRPDLVMAYNNLGFLFKDRGDLERAALELRRGLQEAQEAGFQRGAAMVHGNLGEVLTRMGRWAAARSHLEQAHHLALQLSASGELLETERRMAELDLATGAFEKALRRATDCLARPSVRDNPAEEGNLERVCGEALLGMGRSEEAWARLGRARALQDEGGSRPDRLRAELAWHRLAQREEPWRFQSRLQLLRDEAVQLGARPLVDEASRLLAQWPADTSKACPFALKALVEVAQEISQVKEVGALLEIVTERALSLTKGGRALLLLIEDGREVKVHTARWRADAQRDQLALRMSRTIADRVYSTGESVVITDTAMAPGLQAQDSILSLQLKAIVCVPLKIRDETLGILYVDSQQTAEGLGPQHLPVLEALGAQAAIALHNTRLLRVEKRRQALAAYLAHDFRTPLASLKVLIELIQGEATGLDPELLDLLQSADAQLDQLDRMTRQIVDMEQLQGPLPFVLKAVDLQGVAERALHSLSLLAKQRGVSLRWAIPGDLPPVSADPDALHRIFTNLIGNAVKALEAGAEVTFRASLLDGDELDAPSASQLGWSPTPEVNVARRVQLIFQDNGPGIPEDQARKLSMSREQWLVERGATEKRAGLGLFIVRELVLRQGGTLHCDTSPERGTRFTITLPTVHA